MFKLEAPHTDHIMYQFLLELGRLKAPSQEDSRYFLGLMQYLALNKTDLAAIKTRVKNELPSEREDKEVDLQKFFDLASTYLMENFTKVEVRICLTGMMNAMKCHSRFSAQDMNLLPVFTRPNPVESEISSSETLDDLFEGVVTEDDLDDVEAFEPLIDLDTVPLAEPSMSEVNQYINESDPDPDPDSEDEVHHAELSDSEPSNQEISEESGSEEALTTFFPQSTEQGKAGLMQSVERLSFNLLGRIQPYLQSPALQKWLQGTPPQTAVKPTLQVVEVSPINWQVRWVAGVLDALIFFVIFLCFLPLNYLCGFLLPPEISGFVIWFFNLGMNLILISFVVHMENSEWQGTPGKILMGIGVRNLDGSRVGSKQILKRNLIKMIGMVVSVPAGLVALFLPSIAGLLSLAGALCSLVVLFGFFLAFKPERLALHDKLSQTKIVPLGFVPHGSSDAAL
ncbi:MAG: RDD family protein [Candidatus Cloacimonetes bacterium]|nr:RDD family protein [Candidatus Cloacimonadota bacterium]